MILNQIPKIPPNNQGFDTSGEGVMKDFKELVLKKEKITRKELNRLHTRYCEHFDICDKETDCKAGEDCPWFTHTHSFSSMWWEND